MLIMGLIFSQRTRYQGQENGGLLNRRAEIGQYGGVVCLTLKMSILKIYLNLF